MGCGRGANRNCRAPYILGYSRYTELAGAATRNRWRDKSLVPAACSKPSQSFWCVSAILPRQSTIRMKFSNPFRITRGSKQFRSSRTQGVSTHDVHYVFVSKQGPVKLLAVSVWTAGSYLVVSGDLVLEQGLGSGYPLGAKFFAHSFPCAAGNSDYIFCR